MSIHDILIAFVKQFKEHVVQDRDTVIITKKHFIGGIRYSDDRVAIDVFPAYATYETLSYGDPSEEYLYMDGVFHHM